MAFGPYSPVKRAGNYYFVSGQVGADTAGDIKPDIVSQTHQALKNMKTRLAEQSLDMNDVVKTTVFIKNINDFAVVNEIYETYFAAPRPARSCVGVASLPKVSDSADISIEIEAIAYMVEKS